MSSPVRDLLKSKLIRSGLKFMPDRLVANLLAKYFGVAVAEDIFTVLDGMRKDLGYNSVASLISCDETDELIDIIEGIAFDKQRNEDVSKIDTFFSDEEFNNERTK